MEMTIEAGAKLDIASGAELGDAKDSILKGSKSPRFLPFRYTGDLHSSGSSLSQIFRIGPPNGPGAGFVWELMSLTTYAQDDHTLFNPTPGTSFTGALYAGQTTGVLLSNLLLPGLTFPGAADFLSGQYVRHGETLVMNLSALPAAGQQLGANVFIKQWRECDVFEMSGR